MAEEYDDSIEGVPASGSAPLKPAITIEKAIEMGEYNPEYLATFPEWHTFSNIIKWQMIEQAVRNREKLLAVQWARINNVTDFRNKPHLHEALKNIEEQRRKVLADKERLMLEYSKV